MDYSKDERRILAVLGEYVKRKEYVRATSDEDRKGTSDYMITIPVASLLPYCPDLQNRLVEALDRLRKRPLDTITKNQHIINGRITKARIDTITNTAEIVVSEQLVVELAKMDVQESEDTGDVDALSELVKVGGN